MATLAHDSTEKMQATLERRIFHLKTLYEFTAELSPIVDTRKLLETFLLSAMGVLGAAQGFVVLYDRRDRSLLRVDRGCSEGRPWSVDTAEKRFYEGFQAADNRRLEPMSVTAVAHPETVFPPGEVGLAVHTALLFMLDTSLWGVLGVGLPIGPAPGEEGLELLRGLTASGMTFIKNARAYETIQALNVDLQRRNDELRQTIAALTQARQRIRVLEVARARLQRMAQRELARVGRFHWMDALLITLIATGLALLFNFSGPNGIPLWPEGLFEPSLPQIEAAAARPMVIEGRAVLVDARPQELYDREHIPGALNLPAPLFEIIYPMKLTQLNRPEQTVIVYGRTFSKHYDDEVSRRLRQRHDRVLVFKGDAASWDRQNRREGP